MDWNKNNKKQQQSATRFSYLTQFNVKIIRLTCCSTRLTLLDAMFVLCQWVSSLNGSLSLNTDFTCSSETDHLIKKINLKNGLPVWTPIYLSIGPILSPSGLNNKAWDVMSLCFSSVLLSASLCVLRYCSITPESQLASLSLTLVSSGPACVYVNCGLLTATEVSAASLQQEHATNNQGADVANLRGNPLPCHYLSVTPALSFLPRVSVKHP